MLATQRRKNSCRCEVEQRAAMVENPLNAPEEDTTMTPIANESLPVLASKIRSLEKMTIANVIESGRLLQAAFDCFEHGDRDGYYQWIETEIGWWPRQAARYRDVFDFSQICQTGKIWRAGNCGPQHFQRCAVHASRKPGR